jgi:hypothetical protein
MRPLPHLIPFALVASAFAGEVRDWTCPPGKPFSAELIAADGLHAVLLVPGRGKAVVPFAQLSPADVQFIHEWRARNRNAPLIDPERMAPWPAQAVAENTEVRVTGEDAAASRYRYESAHFAITSDMKLPVSVVREIAASLEATRAAVIALPLGLHLGTDVEKYPVSMYSAASDYTGAGGNTGSGGTFDGASGRMLILLPNLGIKPGTHALGLDYQRNLFILKHEVTHQLLGRWRAVLPVWFDEGLSECMAATPYTQGRYTFQNLDTALHDYVLKWRPGPDRRDIRVIPPASLMTMNLSRWNDEVTAGSAYALYDSAALLVHYFLHHDGKGDSAGVAAYIDDLRRGIAPEEAEAKRLLHGRTREALGAEVFALAKKLGLTPKAGP